MPPKPFFRRNSLKLPAGKQIQCLYGAFNDGTSVRDNIDMAQRIVYNYGDRSHMRVELFNGETDGDIQMTDSDNRTCTGMICLFNKGQWKGHHFIPYVKIGDTWYNGDDENGYLRKRDGPPTKDSKFVNDRGTRVASSYVKYALIFYYDTNAIQHPRTNEDWTGRLLFGQLGTSCGPDAIQTVLMFADGYYERFTLEIYKHIKQYIDPRFNFEGVTENPYAKGELEEQKSILSDKLVQYSIRKDTVEPVSTNFLTYMFIRYYAIDTSPALEFTPENNSARNGVPESNANAYYNALEYVKTHDETDSNYDTSWKFIKSFAKLYPDWLPPSYRVKKEFERLLRKVYDAYDKTPSGTARRNRVLFFIYANLHVDKGETVQTKKMKKYYEVFNEYGKEYEEEHKNEGNIDYNFEKKSYRIVLELYKFFEENWSILMENLDDFQQVFDKLRKSHQGGYKRKTRKASRV